MTAAGLQQYLPFTVLKPKRKKYPLVVIELQQYLPFTVLKQDIHSSVPLYSIFSVATVPTVYGIETENQFGELSSNFIRALQQYLPFTVLKLDITGSLRAASLPLQQYLPFTVLKLPMGNYFLFHKHSCNSTYRLRY